MVIIILEDVSFFERMKLPFLVNFIFVATHICHIIHIIFTGGADRPRHLPLVANHVVVALSRRLS